jgi:hypothetical protein
VQILPILQSLVALVSLNEWLVVLATHWIQKIVAVVAVEAVEAAVL